MRCSRSRGPRHCSGEPRQVRRARSGRTVFGRRTADGQIVAGRGGKADRAAERPVQVQTREHDAPASCARRLPARPGQPVVVHGLLVPTSRRTPPRSLTSSCKPAAAILATSQSCLSPCRAPAPHRIRPEGVRRSFRTANRGWELPVRDRHQVSSYCRKARSSENDMESGRMWNTSSRDATGSRINSVRLISLNPRPPVRETRPIGLPVSGRQTVTAMKAESRRPAVQLNSSRVRPQSGLYLSPELTL